MTASTTMCSGIVCRVCVCVISVVTARTHTPQQTDHHVHHVRGAIRHNKDDDSTINECNGDGVDSDGVCVFILTVVTATTTMHVRVQR